MNKNILFRDEFLLSLNQLESEFLKNKENNEVLYAFDDAIADKIRTNIVGIFRSLFQTSCQLVNAPPKNLPLFLKNCPLPENEQEKLYSIFMKYMEVIPQSWQESMNNAKIHNDMDTLSKETVKFETLKRIKDTFESVFQKNQKELNQ